MICGDAEITIGSTLTALAMPCSGRNILNRVLVPINAPRTVMAGAKLNKPSKSVPFTFYHDVNSIPSEIAKFSPSKFHMTLYLQTVIDGVPLDLVTLLKATVPALRQTRRLTGLTIMFDDRNGLGKLGPQSLGFLNLMEAEHGVDFLATLLRPLGCPTQVLVAGSWFDAFGHQGGYVTGTASTVECLTWDAKAFFFSTPPMPLQAAMSDRKLRLLLEGRKEAGNGEDGV